MAMRIPVDGVDLAVEVQGRGGAVLLIHGFPLDRTLWASQVAALARWRCIAPDLRGAGESSVPARPDDYTMGRYADDLIAVLDALGVAECVACGLSMGGYVLFELLRRHAGRIRAAVFFDTKAEADGAEAKRGREAMADLAMREGAGAVADQMLPKLLARDTVAAQPAVVAQVRQMMARAPVPGLVGALRALRDRPDQTPTLRAIRIPVLAVAGAEDQITPPDGMRAMAQAIRGAEFAVVPAAGHLPPLEQPAAVARLLTGFLERI